MFGCYEEFPKTVHVMVSFDSIEPLKSVQQIIFYVFHRLNSEVYNLSAVTPYLKQKCEVSFEFGVAEGDVFNFLDQNELDRSLRNIEKKELQTLDFFFVVRYHTTGDSGRRVPLRFDYYILRFKFQRKCVEMRIRHEKGTQRVQLDDITDFIAKRINTEFSRRCLSSLILTHFEKVKLQ